MVRKRGSLDQWRGAESVCLLWEERVGVFYRPDGRILRDMRGVRWPNGYKSAHCGFSMAGIRVRGGGGDAASKESRRSMLE